MTGRMLNETPGQGPVRDHVHRVQPDVLPDAHARPRRACRGASPTTAPTAGWNQLNLLATIGGFMIALSMLPFLWNVFISLRSGKVAGDDPWEGNTLEWATTSPPPPYNFDRLPVIRSERPLFDLRHGRRHDHDETVGPDDARRVGPGRHAQRSEHADSSGGSSGASAIDELRRGAARPHGDRATGPTRPRRRDQQPDPRDAALHHLRGDVLRGPVRRVLQRPRRGPRLAADRVPSTSCTSCRSSGPRPCC